MDHLGELLRRWHDFYALLGSAAATLTGLMFVAASIAASYFKERSAAGIQAFFTPTVAHFGAVLLVCIVLVAPIPSWKVLGGLLIALGAVGLAYSFAVWVLIGRHGLIATIDLADRAWYALSPLAGHLMIVAAAVMLLLHNARGLVVLAIAVLVLLLAGLRNAWDITSWVILRAGRD